MKIIHLSDLHVSGGHFVPAWGDAVVSYVNTARPDVTVVTGDLTMKGHREEYEQAHRFLARLQTGSLLVVPGNHDARNEGHALFEKVFVTRYPTYEDESVVICGVDSSQPGTDDGHVGRSHYRHIADSMSVAGKTRILAMHHHLVPIPGTDREHDVPADAGDLLGLCVETKVDLVLSGHKHLPNVRNFENTHLLTAGTATSRGLKGRSFPSFNVIIIEEGIITMQLVDVTGGWGTQTTATAATRPAASGRSLPRVTPAFAFEAEEFHSRIPEETWRHRHGVPQTLDFPSISNWRTA